MSACAIITDLVACGAAPRLTPDGKGIALQPGRLPPELRAQVLAYKPELVRLLAEATNDPAHNLQKPEAEHQSTTLAPGTTPEAAAQTRPPPAPPAYDPGHAALLALAMAYCDRTGASDQARQDWQRDIADTPPELRGDLYQHLRAQLPPAPPAPPRPAPATPPVKQMPPAPWTSLHQPWRAADAAYLAHWGQCPACKQSATGHTNRCATGQHLHDTYMAALATTEGTPK